MSTDEQLFTHLFDVSPFPAVLTRRRDHTIVAINQRTAEIFQIPQDRAIGRCATDYYADPAQREELATRLKRDGLADNVRVEIKRQKGGAFWALVSARLVTCDGEPAVLTVFVDISEQLAAESALKASEQRLVAQSNALTGLTARYADPSDRFDERLRHILEVSAHTLQVERLSMWRFDDQRGAIQCAGMYQRTAGRADSDPSWRVRRRPYFERSSERRRGPRR
jgi:PAS domain S-box-containing protein